jgi:uncharacterized protein YxjI
MGLLRDRDLGGSRYRMRESVFDIGEDYWVENADGDRVLKVNGKALRVRKTFVLESRSGEELLTVRERKLSVRDKMTIERHGDTVGTVRKAIVGPLRERYKIELERGEDLKAHGNIVDHEYEIERDGHTIARISKKWFRLRDTYGIEVAAGEDEVFVLAAVVCIDQMSHERGH